MIPQEVGWLRRLREFVSPRALKGLLRHLRYTLVKTDTPGLLPDGLPEEVAQEVLAYQQRRYEELEALWDRLKSRLAEREPDVHLELLDAFYRQLDTDLARLEMLAEAQHYANASEADRALLARAQHRIEHRVAGYLRDAGVRPSHRVEELMFSLSPALRRWRDAEVSEAVSRAIVLELALSRGISIEEAEAAERARWER